MIPKHGLGKKIKEKEKKGKKEGKGKKKGNFFCKIKKNMRT